MAREDWNRVTRRRVPIIHLVCAVVGVLAVRAMGGSWFLVFAMAATAAATTFVVVGEQLCGDVSAPLT